jgi:hypothetical protein
MKKLVPKILLSIFFLIGQNSANAAFYTAGDIQKGILSHERVSQNRSLDADAQESAVMMGYIASVADEASSRNMACFSTGVTIGQLVAVVRNYLNAHPNIWDVNAVPVIRLAIIEAFPCKK